MDAIFYLYQNQQRLHLNLYKLFAFISAILGGPVGIAMGAHYAWWEKNYDKNTKTLGYIMMIVGSISLMIVSN